MRVLIAFDKFKDSMTAQEAGKIAENYLREQHPNWDFDTVALADGGEGLCEILTQAAGGSLEHVTVKGPLFHQNNSGTDGCDEG